MAWALGCGLVLGALRERTGRVWPGMLLHTLNNLLVFAAG
ncbi:MAG: type II CAAX prenyl endopeptidase Rce1 family protein [Faecalibacterium sp.]